MLLEFVLGLIVGYALGYISITFGERLGEIICEKIEKK